MHLFKIVFLFIFIYICTIYQVVAQVNPFDSLNTKLKTIALTDTNYINTLSAFGIHYQHRGVDSMLLIGNSVIALSTAINYKLGIGNGHKIKGIAFINIQNKDLALYHDSIALAIYESINYIKGIGAVYNNMAVLFNTFGEYHSANIYYNKSINYRKEINDLRGIADCYNNMGNNLAAVGDYNGAAESTLNGLAIRNQINDLDGMGNSYANLGTIYYNMNNLKKSEESFWRSYRIRKSIGSENEIANLYINIGGLYHDKNKYDSAFYYFTEAFKLGKKYNNVDVIITALGNISQVYLSKHKYDEVLKTLNESEKYLDFEIDNENKIEFLMRKSIYYSAIKNNKLAIQFGTQALNTALKIGAKGFIVQAGNILSEAYEKNGNPTQALSYFKLSKQYSDSIYNEENTTKFNDFEYRYKLQGKEQEILKLEASRKLETVTNNRLKLGFVLLFVVLVGVSSLTYYVHSNRKKEKQISELTNKQKQTLEKHNVFKDKMFSIIAHDLRAPISSLLSIFKMLDSDAITQDEFMAIKNNLSNQVTTLSLLLDNLLFWSKNQMEMGFKTNKTNISFNKLIDENIKLFTEIAGNKDVKLEAVINEQINLDADINQVDLIIRNLISNAIKFTKSKGLVSVIANQTKDNVMLVIKDTGVGMDKTTIKKIYAQNVVSNNGTNGEKGTGLGITLVQDFIKNNNATLHISSELNVGTEMIITFNKG